MPSTSWCVRAYPRGRGGARQEITDESWYYGLSPRTRGSQQGAQDALLAAGPIPADAGEPQA